MRGYGDGVCEYVLMGCVGVVMGCVGVVIGCVGVVIETWRSQD